MGEFDDLAEASRVLDETIRDAEDWLIEVNVSGVEAQVPLEGGDYVGIKRLKNREWRLVYGVAEKSTECPLTDVGRLRKVAALMALDRLVDEVRTSSKEFALQINAAVAHARKAMGR